MKTLKEMIAIMQACLDGAEIEENVRNSDRWVLATKPYKWDWHWYDYHVKKTPPSINWDHVHKDFNWLAEAENKRVLLFSAEPIKGSWAWHIVGEEIQIPAQGFSSYKPGNCDWKDSLIERPK